MSESKNMKLFSLSDILNHHLEEEELGRSKSRLEGGIVAEFPRVTEASAITQDGEIFGRCLRSVYYRMKNFLMPNPFTKKSIRTMNMGTHCENYDQEILSQLGILITSNDQFQGINPLQPEQMIRGEIDSLISFPKDELLKYSSVYTFDNTVEESNPKIIIEHKSSYGYYFERDVVGTKTINGEPASQYMLQISIYLDQYGKIKEISDIIMGKLYYISRGDCIQKEYDIMLLGKDKRVFYAEHPCAGKYQSFTPQFIPFHNLKMNDIYKRYAQLHDYLKKNELPPRDFIPIYDASTISDKFAAGKISKTKYRMWEKGKISDLGDIQCGWCPFRKYCLKNINKESK